jgi:hypothetical protein
MDSGAAKEFLISRVLEEAKVDGVNLSEVERKMLYFTEVHPSLPDIYDVNEQFEHDYDSNEYEAKISRLLKNARHRDRKESAGSEQAWKDALNALKNEDHYILVMVGQAFSPVLDRAASEHRLRDSLIYVAVGVALVVILALYIAYHS